MNLLSRVNNFILTTEGAVNPDGLLPIISQSNGQGVFFLLVIIAKADWPILSPKLECCDSTRAGLLFA